VKRSRQAERHSGFPLCGREGPDWPGEIAPAEPTRPGVGRGPDARDPSAAQDLPAPSLHNSIM